MAEICAYSQSQGKARRTLGVTSQHDCGGTSERQIVFAADQNSWRAIPMGRNLADWFGSPLVHVAGTVSGNGSND